MEDNFEKQLLESVGDINSGMQNVAYEKIPPTFTGITTWIQKTNLKCWHCDFTFDNVPVFVPVYIRSPNNVEIEMGTCGNFCTFNCACAYIFNNNMIEFYNHLMYLYTELTGKKITQLIPSPPKIQMIKYGGWLTDMEYLGIVSALEKIQNNPVDFYIETLVSKAEREFHT
jgi:hypothetical protein